MNRLVIVLINIYQLLVSPLFGTRCRFYPSCSHYALEAFKRYNFFKAFYYMTKRLLRCHPFNRGGYDPLP